MGKGGHKIIFQPHKTCRNEHGTTTPVSQEMLPELLVSRLPEIWRLMRPRLLHPTSERRVQHLGASDPNPFPSFQFGAGKNQPPNAHAPQPQNSKPYTHRYKPRSPPNPKPQTPKPKPPFDLLSPEVAVLRDGLQLVLPHLAPGDGLASEETLNSG